MTRPYCNKVMVKVPQTELLKIETKKQVIYLEQEFKLTKDTDFPTLNKMCCDFWGLDHNNYSLYDQKYGHLMALNQDEHHLAHTVSNYFEALKMRYPSLFLLRDELEKVEIKDLVQKESAEIKAKRGKGNSNQFNLIESKDSRADKEAAIKKKNFDIFHQAFPGQEKYKLDKEKKANRVDLSLLPDTYFLTFLVNLLLVISVLFFFFNTRNVAEEYFIRRNIINIFEKETVRDGLETKLLQPFSKISSSQEFYKFMNTTIPFTVFSQNDSKTGKSSRRLAFSKQNPPIGSLTIRTQHWERDQCDHNPIIGPNTEQQCLNSANPADVTFG